VRLVRLARLAAATSELDLRKTCDHLVPPFDDSSVRASVQFKAILAMK
jgi:hypothetical protein